MFQSSQEKEIKPRGKSRHARPNEMSKFDRNKTQDEKRKN